MTLPYLSVSPTDPNREKKLLSLILEDFQSRYQLDLTQDPVAMSRITAEVKRVLLALETEPEAEIDLPYISANRHGPIHLKWKVIRGDQTALDSGGPAAGSQTAESRQTGITIKLPDRKPVLTNLLLAVMAIFYALQWLTTFLSGSDLLAAYGMKVNYLIDAGQYWRLLTPTFLHGSLIHLGFNLYALYILGRRIERFFGPIRFLGLFLIAGITGNLFSYMLTSAPSLGSSTAIFGLLGAEGIFIYQHRKLLGNQYQTALRQIAQVAIVNLVIGFLVPGIDNWGHIGGLIGGAIFTWFGGPAFELSKKPPILQFEDQRPETHSLYVFFGLLIVLSGLAAWLISS